MDRTPMTTQWLANMKTAGERREEAIVQSVLQQPDYPPLAPCPTCSATPERIVSHTEPPAFNQNGAAVLVDFKPCGHGFRVSAEELLNS